ADRECGAAATRGIEQDRAAGPYRRLGRLYDSHQLENPARRQVLFVDAHPEVRQRVLDRVGQRGGSHDRAAFADSAEVELVQRLGLDVLDLDRRYVGRGGQQVVHERGGQVLT